MNMLENLKLLEAQDLFGIITSDLSLKQDKLTADEFHKAYSNDLEKLYSILPIKTYEFLKMYFENSKKIPVSPEFTECLYALQNYGVAATEKDHIVNVCYIYDSKYGRIGSSSEAIEFLKSDEEFYNVELDNDFAKSLFKYLEDNNDLIASDMQIKNIILEVLRDKNSLSIKKFKKILKEKGFEVENLLDFLKNKLNYGTVIVENWLNKTNEDNIRVRLNLSI